MLKQEKIIERNLRKCFQKERDGLLKDLESLRLQLLHKEDVANKAASTANSHQMQLKREIKEIKTQLQGQKASNEKLKEKLVEVNNLLEVSFDQHQEDQCTIANLKKEIRGFQKRTSDAQEQADRTTKSTILTYSEENKSLNMNVERLRKKLSENSAAWNQERGVMQTAIDDLKLRLNNSQNELSDKETQDSRLRKEINKLNDELSELRTSRNVFQAKLESLNHQDRIRIKELEEALQNSEHKYQQSLKNLSRLYEQRSMISEECFSAMRERQEVVSKYNKEFKQLQLSREDVYRKQSVMEEIIKNETKSFMENKKNLNKHSISIGVNTISEIFNSFSGEEDSLSNKNTNKIEELERENQDLHMSLSQLKLNEEEYKRNLEIINTQKEELEGHYFQSKQISETRKEKIESLEIELSIVEKKYRESKRAITNLGKQIQEMAKLNEEQALVMQEQENDKQMMSHELQEMNKKYIDTIEEFELERKETKQQYAEWLESARNIREGNGDRWKTLVSSQINANKLIEEQSKTIEKLLRQNSAKYKENSNEIEPWIHRCHVLEKELENIRLYNKTRSETKSMMTETTMGIQTECEVLRKEVQRLTDKHEVEKHELQLELEEKKCQMNIYIQSIREEKMSLLRRIQEQSITIHNLTVQDPTPIKNNPESTNFFPFSLDSRQSLIFAGSPSPKYKDKQYPRSMTINEFMR